MHRRRDGGWVGDRRSTNSIVDVSNIAHMYSFLVVLVCLLWICCRWRNKLVNGTPHLNCSSGRRLSMSNQIGEERDGEMTVEDIKAAVWEWQEKEIKQ